MRDRIINILNIIKAKGVPYLKDFQPVDGHSFELQTQYFKYDHRTWLAFETRDDSDIVRMELMHLFGYLDIENGADTDQLLHLLSANIPSFQNSSAYLGARFMEGTYFVSLNSTLIFLKKLSDHDLAEMLSIHLFDLTMGLIFAPPEPIKQFQSECG